MQAELVEKTGWMEVEKWMESMSLGQAFMQRYWWGQFKQNFDAERVFRIVVKGDTGFLAAAQVLEHQMSNGKKFSYIPQGPIFDLKNTNSAEALNKIWEKLDEFIDYTEGSETAYLRVQPLSEFQATELLPDFVPAKMNPEPKSTLLIDLDKGLEVIWSEMKPKARYNMGLAERKGVAVNYQVADEIRVDQLEKLWKLYELTMIRENINHVLPMTYFQSLLKEAGVNARIFWADYQGAWLSAAILINSGDTAIYFLGGSSREHSQLMPSYLLQGEMIKWAKFNGFDHYDFRGINQKPDHSWKGFSDFKLKFGGRIVENSGAFDLTY